MTLRLVSDAEGGRVVDLATAAKWQWVEGHWESCRPKLAAYWPRIPERALLRLRGDRSSLVEAVREAYALQLSGAEAHVDAWVSGLSQDARRR